MTTITVKGGGETTDSLPVSKSHYPELLTNGVLDLEKLQLYKNYARYYKHPARPGLYKSVTSILNNIAKPGVDYWRAEQSLLHATDNISDLEYAATLPEEQRKDFLKGFRRDALNSDRASYAKDMGLALHSRVEAHLTGQPRPNIKEYLNHEVVDAWFDQVITFLNRNKMRTYATEVALYNSTYMYAGAVDLIVEYQDMLCIVDWKTGKRVYPEAAAQIAAYAMAEEMLTSEAEIVDMPPITRGLVVQPNVDVGLNVAPVDLVIARERFESALWLEQTTSPWAQHEYEVPTLKNTDWII